MCKRYQRDANPCPHPKKSPLRHPEGEPSKPSPLYPLPSTLTPSIVRRHRPVHPGPGVGAVLHFLEVLVVLGAALAEQGAQGREGEACR